MAIRNARQVDIAFNHLLKQNSSEIPDDKPGVFWPVLPASKRRQGAHHGKSFLWEDKTYPDDAVPLVAGGRCHQQQKPRSTEETEGQHGLRVRLLEYEVMLVHDRGEDGGAVRVWNYRRTAVEGCRGR